MQNNIFDIPSIGSKKIINFIINNNRDAASVTNLNKANLLSFSSYLYKLRKGILDPNKIKYNCNEKTDLKIHLEKESFIHPVLGKCLVVKRIENGAIVKTKIGNIKVKE